MRRLPIISKGNELFFEINLIGYKKQGESMVLSVKNEYDNILWCGIIDSYEFEKENRTKEIFRIKL